MKWLTAGNVEEIKALTANEQKILKEGIATLLSKILVMMMDKEASISICNNCFGVSIFDSNFCPHCGEGKEKL